MTMVLKKILNMKHFKSCKHSVLAADSSVKMNECKALLHKNYCDPWLCSRYEPKVNEVV